MLIGNNYNESLLWKWSFNMNDTLLSEIQNSFHCGSAESARLRAKAGVPVWRYLFAGNSPWSTTGATHGMEGQYIFGNGNQGLHLVFKSAIGSFVKDPMNELKWPQYNLSREYDPELRTREANPNKKIHLHVLDMVEPPL